MNQQTYPKIPYKAPLSLFLGESLQQKVNDYNYICIDLEPKAHQSMLLKYYPKYCHELKIDERYLSWKVLSRMKQIKTTKGFNYTYIEKKKGEIKKQIKTLLQNKRRSIQFLPRVANGWGRCSVPFLEMCPFFPKLKVLNAFHSEQSPYKHDQPSKNFLPKKMRKSYGYFWNALKSLQILNLLTPFPETWLILQKIQSSEKFLSSLKVFILTIDLSHREVFDRFPQNKVYEALLKYQGALKYVTHLNFYAWANFNIHHVKPILDSCPNLQSLSFPIQEEFSDPHLVSFQSLQALTLDIENPWTFIETFSFPTGIKELTLYLDYETKRWDDKFWQNLSQEPKDESSLAKHQKLLTFFEKFKQLTCLKSLELITPQFIDTTKMMKSFILPILRSIPKLEEFQCQLTARFVRENNPFDISTFFEGMGGSLQQLKSFKIFQPLSREDRGCIYSISHWDLVTTFNAQKLYHCPNLKEISIDAFISQDFDFKNFLKMISNSEANPPILKKKISFSKVYVDSVESLCKILKMFKEAEKYQTLEISLEIKLCLRDWNEIIENFYSPIIPASNVSIHLQLFLPASDKSSIGLTLFRSMQKILGNIFGKMKFDLYYLVKEKSEYTSSGEDINCQPAILNNYVKFDYHYYYPDESDDEEELFEDSQNIANDYDRFEDDDYDYEISEYNNNEQDDDPA